jgi:hypothetical protein
MLSQVGFITYNLSNHLINRGSEPFAFLPKFGIVTLTRLARNGQVPGLGQRLKKKLTVRKAHGARRHRVRSSVLLMFYSKGPPNPVNSGLAV